MKLNIDQPSNMNAIVSLIAGWIMQLNYFLFVKRNWREDETSVAQYVDYYRKLGYKCRLLLFPEGTDLSENNKLRSDKFAAAHNMPVR